MPPRGSTALAAAAADGVVAARHAAAGHGPDARFPLVRGGAAPRPPRSWQSVLRTRTYVGRRSRRLSWVGTFHQLLRELDDRGHRALARGGTQRPVRSCVADFGLTARREPSTPYADAIHSPMLPRATDESGGHLTVTARRIRSGLALTLLLVVATACRGTAATAFPSGSGSERESESPSATAMLATTTEPAEEAPAGAIVLTVGPGKNYEPDLITAQAAESLTFFIDMSEADDQLNHNFRIGPELPPALPSRRATSFMPGNPPWSP